MKRLIMILLAMAAALSLCACSGQNQEEAGQTTAPPATAEPLATETAQVTASVSTEESAASAIPSSVEPLSIPEAVDGWQESYLAFLDDNYDIFAALWPEGMTGVGFVDLDLDGTPEMIVFDQGASATLGAQLFDLVDGQVACVSSTLDSASGAFGDEYFTTVSVCTSYFEAFRLSYTVDDGWCFWVDSANGTLESTWNEIIRFDCENGALTPVSVCTRYLESDEETGLVVVESYTVSGQEAQASDYDGAANIYLYGQDAGYEAAGVFLWSDNSYDTTYDGLMAMARAAVDAYKPIVTEDISAS
ncbi:MAG: hypothetical protein LUE21_05140 [Oscillospiraceae bacterium]|nr:hypothetical protein [Oscillospiraceae bacterium]